MKKTSYFLFILFMLASCKKQEQIPACIKSTIDENKNNSNWKIEEVDEYEFQNKLVYVFVPVPQPDVQTEIKNSVCTMVCALGGIAGIMKCNGESFYSVAVLKRVIWKK
ncbi:MAG: hypothetical protein M3Z26_03105 [Bacteroidota bacterium]|nr:hypothetical protein [Bacteroidota bacterium]